MESNNKDFSQSHDKEENKCYFSPAAFGALAGILAFQTVTNVPITYKIRSKALDDGVIIESDTLDFARIFDDADSDAIITNKYVYDLSPKSISEYVTTLQLVNDRTSVETIYDHPVALGLTGLASVLLASYVSKKLKPSAEFLDQELNKIGGAAVDLSVKVYNGISDFVGTFYSKNKKNSDKN